MVFHGMTDVHSDQGVSKEGETPPFLLLMSGIRNLYRPYLLTELYISYIIMLRFLTNE